ncbi:MAG: tetratricopeptide repeat protein [Armatimonadetes bacterium]|nr:tetratricopeptide repeat protein [Armatimonadota bacterium]
MKNFVILVAALALLAGCSQKKAGSLTSETDRNAAVLQVKALTTMSFAKLLADEPLDESDKSNAERALPIVASVIEFSPNQPAYFVLRARCQWVLGKTDEAKKSLEQAVSIQDQLHTAEPVLEAEAHHDLARLAILDNKWDDAGREAQKALTLFPDDSRYLTTNASVLLQTKDIAGARAAATKALKADPQNSVALSMLKMIQASEDGPKKAGP